MKVSYFENKTYSTEVKEIAVGEKDKFVRIYNFGAYDLRIGGEDLTEKWASNGFTVPRKTSLDVRLEEGQKLYGTIPNHSEVYVMTLNEPFMNIKIPL